MTESLTEYTTGCWATPQCPFAIEYSPRVLDDIRLAVIDAFFSLPRGGAEIGGLLLGRHEEGRLIVTDQRPLECEHAFGPSFTLSPRDEVKLAELLAETRGNAHDAQPVGWYHSHTRSDIFLSETDLNLHKKFFTERWQVALVLKPHTFHPTKGGFFFREADGSIHASSSYQEFELENLPVRPVPAGEIPALPTPTQRARREREPRGPVITVDASVEHEPAVLVGSVQQVAARNGKVRAEGSEAKVAVVEVEPAPMADLDDIVPPPAAEEPVAIAAVEEAVAPVEAVAEALPAEEAYVASEEPLADARGSEANRDGEGAVADTSTAPAVEEGFGAIEEPLADARGSEANRDGEGAVADTSTAPAVEEVFGAIEEPLADARGSAASHDGEGAVADTSRARAVEEGFGAIEEPLADARGSELSHDGERAVADTSTAPAVEEGFGASEEPLADARGSEANRDGEGAVADTSRAPAVEEGFGAIEEPLADARGSEANRDGEGAVADTSTAPAVEEGFGAIEEPLADARGSEASHDGEGAVADTSRARAVEEGFGAIEEPLADARGSELSHDAQEVAAAPAAAEVEALAVPPMVEAAVALPGAGEIIPPPPVDAVFVPGQVEAIAPEQPAPLVAPEPVSTTAAEAVPKLEIRIAPDLTGMPSPRLPDAEPRGSRRRLRLLLAVAASLVVVGTGFGTRGLWLPRLAGVARPVVPVASAAPVAPPSLGLNTIDSDGQLQIRWDRGSAAVRKGVDGILEITDGNQPQPLPLDAAQLQTGVFTYARQSAKVDVSLVIHGLNGKQVREATSFLGQPPAPKAAPVPAKPVPAKDDAPLRKERDALARQVAQLKSDLNAQTLHARELEKSAQAAGTQAARIKKLEQDLAAQTARAKELEKSAQVAGTQAARIKKLEQDLAAQTARAKELEKSAQVAGTQAARIKKLEQDLAGQTARAKELEKSKQAMGVQAARIKQLEKANQDLQAQLQRRKRLDNQTADLTK